MFLKKKNEEAVTNEDILTFLAFIADKIGVDLEAETEETKTTEEVDKEEEVEKVDNEEVEKVDNEEVDKKKDIDDVGGFLKSKGLTDEDIRYVMKLMEETSYNEDLNGRDNACKNEEKVEAEKVEKKVRETGTDNLEKKEDLKRPVLNAIKKNSVEAKTMNLTRAERIKASNKKYSIK